MKRAIAFACFMLLLVGIQGGLLYSQSLQMTSFPVKGPCMACGAARLQQVTQEIPGVVSAKLDGKQLQVQYEGAKTSAIDIQLELSFKGYDAGDFGHTPDPNLPECCRKPANPQATATSVSVPLGGKAVVSEIKEKPTNTQTVFEAPKQGPSPKPEPVKTTPVKTTPPVTGTPVRGEVKTDIDEDEEVNVLMEAEEMEEEEDISEVLEEEEVEDDSDLWADDVNDDWGGWYDSDDAGQLQKEEDVELEEEDRSSVSSGPADIAPKKEKEMTPEELEKIKREQRLKAAKESIEQNNKPK